FGGLSGQGTTEFINLRVEFGCRIYLVNETCGERPVGADRTIGHNQPASPVAADGPNQSACAARPRDHAHVEFRQRIMCRVARQAKVAGQRHFERGTETWSLVRDNERFFERFEFVVELMPGGLARAAPEP